MHSQKGLFPAEGVSFRLSQMHNRLEYYIGLLTLFTLGIVAVFAVYEGYLSVLLFFYFFGLSGLIIVRWLGKTETHIFLVLYSVNVLIVFAIYFIYMHRYGNPYFGGGSDDKWFEEMGRAFIDRADWWNYALLTRLPRVRNVTSYVYFLSLIQRAGDLFGGFHTLTPRFLNAAFLAGLGVLVFRAGRYQMKLSHKTAVIIALLTGLLPITTYVSAHTFRDVLVTFLSFVVVYLWSDIFSSTTRKRLLVLLATSFLIYFLWEMRVRSAQITILLVAATVFLSYINVHSFRNAVLLLLILSGVLLTLRLLHIINSVPDSWWTSILRQYRSYTEHRLGIAKGLSTLIFGAPMPVSLLLRLGYLAISPLPQVSSELERSWLSIGTFIQVGGIPFVVLGMFFMLKRREGLQYLLAFVVFYLSVAWITFTMRHLLMFYPFALLIAGYGYEQYRLQKLSVRWVYLSLYFLAIFSGVSYFVIIAG
ncbi:MAG: hypothetical protein GXP38_14235 [Chloroflexi bacterium]|nr:hypothetical protein [Chloroflexota bacterium]